MSSVELNPAYAKPQIGTQIKTAFFDNEAIPNIKLGQILKNDSYDKLKQTVERATKKPEVDPIEYRFSATRLKLPQLAKTMTAFLKPIFGTDIALGDEWRLVSLTWKDYSMIVDTQIKRKGHDVIIDVTDDDFPENAGADLVYTTGGDETVEIPASANTLIIVKIDEKTRSFMRYANHYAKDKKRNFLIQHI